MVLAGEGQLTVGERAELRDLLYCVCAGDGGGAGADRVVAGGGEIAALAGVSRPTVDLWPSRYDAEGIKGLFDQVRGAGREQVPASASARILALARTSQPVEQGLSHWSSREMAEFVKRAEGLSVSHHYVAKLWREAGLKPHRQGTFKVSKDPEFAEKVADVVGLYLDTPGGAVVLCLDEKTQIEALDRIQPLLPIGFDAAEKRTRDYDRHGTTNLFAAFVNTGEVLGECKPTRNSKDFLTFLKKAVKPHKGQGYPHRAGQPLHSHRPRCHGVDGEAPARGLPFHSDRFVLDQPNRNLVRHRHPPVHPPRNLP
jgi:transposase